MLYSSKIYCTIEVWILERSWVRILVKALRNVSNVEAQIPRMASATAFASEGNPKKKSDDENDRPTSTVRRQQQHGTSSHLNQCKPTTTTTTEFCAVVIDVCWLWFVFFSPEKTSYTFCYCYCYCYCCRSIGTVMQRVDSKPPSETSFSGFPLYRHARHSQDHPYHFHYHNHCH